MHQTRATISLILAFRSIRSIPPAFRVRKNDSR
jgi:hypothetical protein